jgi:hypothetical protein
LAPHFQDGSLQSTIAFSKQDPFPSREAGPNAIPHLKARRFAWRGSSDETVQYFLPGDLEQKI